jgi:hypothetical protein
VAREERLRRCLIRCSFQTHEAVFALRSDPRRPPQFALEILHHAVGGARLMRGGDHHAQAGAFFPAHLREPPADGQVQERQFECRGGVERAQE